MLEAVGYVILGLILILAPGLLLSTLLYPKRDSFDFWKRIGVSLGLGAILAAVVGYVIAMPGVGTLSLGSFVIATLILSAIIAILSYLRGGLGTIFSYIDAAKNVFRRQKAEQEPQIKTPEEPKTT